MDRGAIDTNNALKAYLEKGYHYTPQFMFINCIEAHENMDACAGAVQVAGETAFFGLYFMLEFIQRS